MSDLCKVCSTPGCIEIRGKDFHVGATFGGMTCDYSGTPPFADAEWANSPDAMCLWCAGTGHPHADESYGFCACPDVPRQLAALKAQQDAETAALADFKLESQAPGTYVPNDEDRRDWIERITSKCFKMLGLWDQDFVSDQSGRTQFTAAQRSKIDALWMQWKGCC